MLERIKRVCDNCSYDTAYEVLELMDSDIEVSDLYIKECYMTILFRA